jgi:hypothetical protein
MTGAIRIAPIICLVGVCVAQAVVIRHDVPEKKYLDLAAKAEFQAGCVTVLDPRGGYTGVLIADRFVLTAGHPVFGFLKEGQSDGPLSIKVRHGNTECDAEFAYIHTKYDNDPNAAAHGTDLAVLRLKPPGLPNVTPARIWIGGVTLGDRFVGVGQGRSGTGKDNDEPKAPGTFRGYENTIDYITGDEEYQLFRSDFDDGTEESSTLARIVYARKNVELKGKSSKKHLPLEGTTAAGDSGGGVWVFRANRYHLAGIASFRYYSNYGAQPGYANLSHPANVEWLKEVGQRENVTFEMSKSK